MTTSTGPMNLSLGRPAMFATSNNLNITRYCFDTC